MEWRHHLLESIHVFPLRQIINTFILYCLLSTVYAEVHESVENEPFCFLGQMDVRLWLHMMHQKPKIT